MRFTNVARALMVGSMLALSAGVASAAHLTIIDTESDVTVQEDANFEYGFVEFQNNQHDWSFTGNWIATSGSTGQGIIYFVKPGTNDLVDIYNVSWTWSGIIATMNGRFESDDNGVLVSGRTIPAGFPTVDATPGNIDVLGLFRDPTTGDPVTLPSNLTLLVNFDYPPVPTKSVSWSSIKGNDELLP